MRCVPPGQLGRPLSIQAALLPNIDITTAECFDSILPNTVMAKCDNGGIPIIPSITASSCLQASQNANAATSTQAHLESHVTQATPLMYW